MEREYERTQLTVPEIVIGYRCVAPACFLSQPRSEAYPDSRMRTGLGVGETDVV